jgi:hypothetical protein
MRIQFLLPLFWVLLVSSCQQQSNTADSTSATPSAPQPLTEEEKTQYQEKGQKIALSVFTALSGQLQQAMGEGGVPQAIEHCNLVASPLVDSLSKEYNATVRRTSLKIRNPKDAPTAEERQMLEQYQATHAAGGALKPKIIQQGENIAFYAPIGIQPLCLKCHGKIGENIADADYNTIKSLYPTDEAIGYQEGDLRGMWSISFVH